MGVPVGIGSLINKNTFEGGCLLGRGGGGLIGRRALNQIITVYIIINYLSCHWPNLEC